MRLLALLAALLLVPQALGASVLAGEPGWTPPVDPDSMAVRTGRRPAPLVAQRFQGGAPSLEALARQLLVAAARGDRAGLSGLCVTRGEFARILWPEFPQSRPITGASAEDGWYFLARRNTGGVGRILADWQGQELRLVRVERAGQIARYRNFRLHRGLTIVARGADGALVAIDDLRTVAERRGAFKIYSLRD
ncbi:MAG: hypothetical protein ABI983_09050 [Acidobacteriota bacterium]